MRILYVGNHQPDVAEERRWSTEWHVGETIRAAGHELTREQERSGVWADVPRRAKEVDAEMVLWTRTYGMDRDLDAQRAGLDALRGMGVPSVAWHLDKFWDLPRADQVTSEPWFTADFVFTADGGNQDRWDEAGVNHHWLPPAVFAPECVLGSPAPEFATDVAFVGSWANYHPEWKHRRDLVKWCFHSFGGARFKTWPRANQGQVRGARLSDLYATAKVVVGDSCMVGGTGSYWCADTETEMLTRRGWLRYSEVRRGDEAYGIDPVTGAARWTPVDAVTVFPEEQREMLSMESRAHSSLTTLDHRWLVESPRKVNPTPEPTDRCPECGFAPRVLSPRAVSIHRAHRHGIRFPKNAKRVAVDRARQFRTSREIGQNDRIPIAAPCSNLPSDPKYRDEFVELIAWAWTEGSFSEGNYRNISQSHRVNAPYVARIRACLTALFGGPTPQDERMTQDRPRWKERQNDERGMTMFALNATAGRLLTAVAPSHVVDQGFVAELTMAQLRLFVESSIDADGCRKTSTVRGSVSTGVSLAQKDPGRLDAFEMACALLGIATSRSKAEDCWLVHIKRRAHTAPMRDDLPEAKVERVVHDGIVWCPTTGTGTWLARRRGTVYFTGNSDRVPETLGRGGLLLHPFTEGLTDSYTPGVHLDCWEMGDWTGLRTLIDRYLADEALRTSVRLEGHEHVKLNHTYANRLDDVLRVVAGG